MKYLITLLFGICSLFLTAQTQVSVLDHNNTNVSIMNGGDFFWNLNTSKYEVPSGSGTHAIFSGALWIGAQADDEPIHLAAMTYRQRGQDFWPGPHSKDTNATRARYDKMWTITQDQINDHISDPSNPINTILTWPGNGDTTKGEPWALAPFVDVNQNGVYEPKQGDYPKIKGKAATYCIYSDQGFHTETGGNPIGIDVHQMFYQDDVAAAGEVNFASFTIVNRSDISYDTLRFGVFVDFDLGNFTDDFIGCDSAASMIYAYNGDDNDDGVLGYGLNPPAQNMMFLNSTMGAAMYYNNNFNPIDGNPNTAADFFSYLSGRFKDGSLAVHPDGYTTKYHYSGDPVLATGWTEEGANNTPSDRRMLAVASDTSFAQGDVLCFDIAFVYGRASTGGPIGSIQEMKDNASEIQTYYNNNSYGWKTTSCSLGATDPNSTAGIFERDAQAQFAVFPNPATNILSISGAQFKNDLYIIDAMGKVQKKLEAGTTSIDISTLTAGVYVLRTELGSIRFVKL